MKTRARVMFIVCFLLFGLFVGSVLSSCVPGTPGPSPTHLHISSTRG